MTKHPITLRVNGEEHEIDVPARRLLADALRDDLNLTGTKRGCETGVCGACTVHLDGAPMKSCLMLALQAKGRAITTIEGLAAADGALHPLQQAFLTHGGFQCGYCKPGLIMTAAALLARNPAPDEAAIRAALTGNLCRCTGYVGIVESIRAAAAAMPADRVD